MANQNHSGIGDNVAGNKQVKNYVAVNSIWIAAIIIVLGLSIWLIPEFMPKPIPLSGYVLDEKTPVVGAEVVVVTPDNARYSQFTDMDGTFNFKADEVDLRKVSSIQIKASKEDRMVDSTFSNFDAEAASFVLTLPKKIVIPPLNISILNFDPRFTDEDGTPMNWGGGSQSMFTAANSKADKPNVWEVCASGMGEVMFEVSAVYNAPPTAPSCLITEWGLKLTKASNVPADGAFEFYPAGGAEGEVRRGKGVIKSPVGEFPLTVWYSDDEDSKIIPKNLQYFKPGEVIGLKVSVRRDAEYNGFDTPNGPKNTDAVFLRLYAQTKISGKTIRFFSDEYVKLLIPHDSNYINRDVFSMGSDDIEDLRQFTIVQEPIKAGK